MTTKVKELVQQWNSRISWDTYFMSMTFLASSRSPCERLKVGCVIVKNNRVVSMGYNGFLTKCPHESIVYNNHEQAIVHAEQNAITDAARRGVSLENTTAYITHYPCANCAKLLCSSGITNIIYSENYKNDPLVEKLMNQASINITQIIT